MAVIQYQIHAEPVLANPETVSEDRWHEPWSEPVRFKIVPALAIALIAASGNSFNPLPIPNTSPSADKYWDRFEEPVRTKPGLAAAEHQFLALVEASPFAETTTEDRYHQPWSEPIVKTKVGLLAAAQQALALTEAIFTETTTEDRYHQPWSEPVRIKPGLSSSLQLSQVWLFYELVLADKWIYQWSDPVQLPVGLKAPYHPAFPAYTEAPPFTEATTESRWHFAWSEPVRIKPGLAAPEQKADWLVEASFKETVTESRWHFPWSEPVRIKPGLLTSDQTTSVLGAAPPYGETIYYSKWGYQWSEPVRLKVGIGSVLQPHAEPFPIVPPTLNPMWTLANVTVRVRFLGLNVPALERL